jgi:hypothetical protein
MKKKEINNIFIILALLCAGIFVISIIENNPYLFAVGFCCIVLTTLLYLGFNWFNELPVVVPDITKEMAEIEIALQLARNLYLETEVVTFALLAIKENPFISITEAINRGLKEWNI